VTSTSAYGRLLSEGVLLLIVGIWWISALEYPPFVLPSPMNVAASLARFLVEPELWLHVAISLARVIGAVVAATSLAVALALAVRAAPILEEAVERRILTFLSSFPSVGWAILGVIWFQISSWTVLFIQTAIILPFCLINALSGVRQIDPELDELGRSLTRAPIRRFVRLTLPLFAPFLVAGVRVAYGICWKIALVAELFGASSGLGYLLMRAQSISDASMVFSICLVIVFVFGVTDWLLLRPLARRFSFNQEAP
jgi:ABC-type nitrate/sulfonate/bicarbonate transport system permease component